MYICMHVCMYVCMYKAQQRLPWNCRSRPGCGLRSGRSGRCVGLGVLQGCGSVPLAAAMEASSQKPRLRRLDSGGTYYHIRAGRTRYMVFTFAPQQAAASDGHATC